MCEIDELKKLEDRLPSLTRLLRLCCKNERNGRLDKSPSKGKSCVSTAMTSKSPFKWRHFVPEIILWGVRWYCSCPISYRVDELQEKEELSEKVELRQNKYLNNIIEQNHRFIKRLVKPGMGFGSFNTARRTIKGYEIINMMRKGQIKGVEKRAVKERVLFINPIFGVVA